jgi:hypothetical protein
MRYTNHPIVPDFYLPVSTETIAGTSLYPYYKAPNMGSITADFITKNKLKGVYVVDEGSNLLVRAISSEEHSDNGSTWIFNAKQANAFISLLQTNPQSIKPDLIHLGSGDAWGVQPTLQQGQVTTSLLWSTNLNVSYTDMGNEANPWIRRYFRRPDEHLFDLDAQYHRMDNVGWLKGELDELLFGIGPKFHAFVSIDLKYLYVKAIGDYRVTERGCIRTFDSGLTRAFANVLGRKAEFKAMIVSTSAGAFEDTLMLWMSTEQPMMPLPIDGEWTITYNLTGYVQQDTCQSVYDGGCSVQQQPQLHVNNIVNVPTQAPIMVNVDTKKDTVVVYPATNVPQQIVNNTTTITPQPKSENGTSWWMWMICICVTLAFGGLLYWFANRSENGDESGDLIDSGNGIEDAELDFKVRLEEPGALSQMNIKENIGMDNVENIPTDIETNVSDMSLGVKKFPISSNYELMDDIA